MNYQNCIKKLFEANLFGGVKLGLKNMQLLASLFGYPERSFKTIHVAGTNGKGSVSLKIAKGLEANNLKVGLFTSPHISTFRERIQINGAVIPEESVISIMELLFETAEKHSIPATFFELTTLLGFLYFRDKKIDIAVIETGLGGRLDATNIIIPELSIITSIGFDHMEVLGDTIEKITFEKAGIIKAGVPVLIGPTVPSQIIDNEAMKKSASVLKITDSFDNYDAENSAIAKAAMKFLNLPESSIDESIKLRPPCRLEVLEDSIILDVAHNPDGLRRLFLSLKKLYPNTAFRVILGLSKSKDLDTCLKIVSEEAENIYLVEAKSERAASKELLAEKLAQLTGKSFPTFTSISKAIQEADHLRLGRPLIITGTFFIMAEAKQALNLSVPCDPTDLNEKF